MNETRVDAARPTVGRNLGNTETVLFGEERGHDTFGPDGLSLIIPAWNEERRLPITLDQYLLLLEAYNIPSEVIVVVDGVADRTAEVAASYGGRGVRVLKFDRRLGKGGAVMAGLRDSRFDVVGFVDADAPVSAVSLAYALSELVNADAAVASRWHPKSKIDRKQPFSRRVFSRSWSILARAILNLKVKDTQCGAKFFRRDAVMQVLPQVTLTNWAFDAALLFHMSRAGFRIVEVPVNWTDDPDTKLSIERVAPAMLLSLVGVRLMSLSFLPQTTRAWAGWFHRHFV